MSIPSAGRPPVEATAEGPDGLVTNGPGHATGGPAAVVRQVETLSAGWYRMERYVVDVTGPNRRSQRQRLEVCHRGDSAAVLLVHRRRGTVLLTRQFRLPVLVNGDPDGHLIEVPGGLLSGDDPETAARRETEEETGIRPAALRRVLLAHMTPCLVTERVHLFVAEYDDADRVGAGGGLAEEGEDIELLELSAAEVFERVERGEIVDGRTLLLLYYARAHNLLAGLS